MGPAAASVAIADSWRVVMLAPTGPDPWTYVRLSEAGVAGGAGTPRPTKTARRLLVCPVSKAGRRAAWQANVKNRLSLQARRTYSVRPAGAIEALLIHLLLWCGSSLPAAIYCSRLSIFGQL